MFRPVTCLCDLISPRSLFPAQKLKAFQTFDGYLPARVFYRADSHVAMYYTNIKRYTALYILVPILLECMMYETWVRSRGTPKITKHQQKVKEFNQYSSQIVQPHAV